MTALQLHHHGHAAAEKGNAPWGGGVDGEYTGSVKHAESRKTLAKAERGEAERRKRRAGERKGDDFFQAAAPADDRGWWETSSTIQEEAKRCGSTADPSDLIR